MEVIGIYGILFGIVGIFFLIYTYFLYRKNLKIKARIKAEYGKKPEWKLDERDYASMKKYYQQKKTDEPTIDDITFNDLNMDEIFKQVKNTQSSIGDEYSYDFFRRQKNPDLTHFEAAVQCMSFCVGLILFSIVLRKIYQAFEALGMFTRMVRAAKVMVKLELPAFKEETDQLRKNLKVFKNITGLADYIVQISGSSNSLMMIITSYFSLYGYAYFIMVKLFQKYRSEALKLYETIGYIELCISIASYRESLPYYCLPNFNDNDKVTFEEIVHPLLKEPIPNTRSMGNKVLITGSNASGKSTFARTLAINAIFGQLFNTCLAKSFSFKPCAVYSSMNLKDDIVTGDSFYMAEIKSLKRLLKIAESKEYAMIFMDEMFKGTNMIERISAASIILKKFADLDCFICLATHDVELSRILGERYENYHFREVVTEDDILFDYTLQEGVTTGSNAIKLLAYCHYDQEIVDQAEKYAENYRLSGEWEKLWL